MIKLVACDLDGTLFNSNMEISEENRKAIVAAQNNGIEFLVATGRAPKESKILLKDANIQTGFINLNGALVFDVNNNLIVKHPLPQEKANKLISYLNNAGFYYEILTAEHVYSQDLSQRIANVAHVMVNLNPGMTINNIEINFEKAQKGIALLDYAKAKGIEISETAAIGDNLNDISMIRDAGVGVAMGNAVSAIKQIADIETTTNNENGVAKILNKFIAENRHEG